MNHRLLIFSGIAALLAFTWLVLNKTAEPQASVATAPGPIADAVTANAARQRRDGIIAPARKTASPNLQQMEATRNAMPTRETSLLTLDLSRPPKEAELRRAGQLNEALSPTGPAEPTVFADPAARSWQEKDNLRFGQAINAWNEGRFDEALQLFLKHVHEHPQSPWAAESRLHVGRLAMQRGHYPGCHMQAEAIIRACPRGTDAYQKALMLKARALILEGRNGEAGKTYQEALRTETRADRKSLAASWLQALSQRKENTF